MASQVVVDSGILLATALQETYSEVAKTLVENWTKQNIQLNAPYLFRYEIVAVIRKNVFQGRLTLHEGVEAYTKLLAYPVRLFIDDELLKRGYGLATELNRPTAYDAQYLAVAERLGCDFWTADERLFNVCSPRFQWVRWIGNIQL